MNKIFVYPYKAGSQSAKSLAEALGARRIKLEGSSFKESKSRSVINWGSSTCPYESMNSSEAVKAAGNKLTAFEVMISSGVSCPDFTTDRDKAIYWLMDGEQVVVRHDLTGSSGKGIQLIKQQDFTGPDQVPNAPLYTKYIKKTDEYRVHVFDGRVIDVQKKMKKKDVPNEETNYQIRNLAGGFIFGREGINPPDSVSQQAILAVQSLGLLFGAADIGYHPDLGTKVYEVNTAPGLEGQTVISYAEAFKEYLSDV